MTEAVASLCRFAAAAAVGDATAARRAARAARRAHVPRRATEEVALMLVLYAGFPAALEALRALGAAWPGAAHATREGSQRLWTRRGERLARRVYGPVLPRLLQAVRALHPDLATWMIEHGYGRVLARPGLTARVRELVTVSALAATGWRRQLVSHLLGARRLGAAPGDIRAALAHGSRVAGPAARGAARGAWAEAFPATTALARTRAGTRTRSG